MASKKPCFTFGDKVRRKNGGPIKTVSNIGNEAYYFSDGTFAMIDDQECYVLHEASSRFFRVADSLRTVKLRDHLQHGYETVDEFRSALMKLVDWWGGRVGEYVDHRHEHLLLAFHDTPGGLPDKAWIPLYLLSPCARPDYMDIEEISDTEKELNRIFFP